MLLSPLGPVARAGRDASRPRVSFEFFPPRSDEAEARLWNAINRLAPLKPDFVSVTYGAGGSTRERTHRTVQRILEETALTPAAHLTCVEASRTEVDAVGYGFQRREGEPVRGRSEPIAIRAGSDHEVEESLDTAAGAHRSEEVAGLAAVGA